MQNDKPLGCLSWTSVAVTISTALIIAGLVYGTGSAMFSAGSLNGLSGAMLGNVPSHAKISNDCAYCHPAPWDSDYMQDRCVLCHTDIGAEMVDSTRLHGILRGQSAILSCRICHPEHRGADAPLTDVAINDFPHQRLGFATTSHQYRSDGTGFSCKDCHTAKEEIYKTNDCAGCHSQINPGFMVNHTQEFGEDCLACHDGNESLGKQFDHAKTFFALSGKHASVVCSKCHVDARVLADFETTSSNCSVCHLKDDAHEKRLGLECDQCHTPAGWSPAKFDHDLSAFELTGKHQSVDCKACHVLPHQLKGTPTACAACHQKDDRHAGSEGLACESCHDTAGWKPSIFNHSTVFVLDGKHSQLDCQSCHATAFQFKGAATTCVGCHQKDDRHAGTEGTACETCHITAGWTPTTFEHARVFKLDGKHAAVTCLKCHTVAFQFKDAATSCFGCHQKDDIHAGTEGTACEICHTPNAWKPSSFDHKDAAFPLTGAHVNVICAKCHNQPGMFKGTASNCVSCHAKNDPHKGSLGIDCSSCHTTSVWKPSTFNHDNSVFKLTGAHLGVVCSKCHLKGVFKGTSQDCKACHAIDDPHAGAYGQKCDQCHTTNGWRPATFDHNLSVFKLTGKHASLACAQCHANNVYKGTPQDCASCHPEPAFHAGTFSGIACSQCHTMNGWLPASYNAAHTFPVNHGKSFNSCSACHQSTLNQWTCYYCHSQITITQKHQEKGINDFANCIKCHPDGKTGD